jgi:ketosteroid isomerase-like protein
MLDATQPSELPMKASPTLYVICAAVVLNACDAKSPSAKGPVDTARIVDAIKTDEVHWNSDYKSGDAGVVAAHYATNATLMIPGAAPLVGAAAIKAGLEQALSDKAFRLSFASDKVDVAASGDLAAARGSYTETATDPKTSEVVTDKGSYVTIYKPQPDGAWKAVWDINTPGAPPARPVGAQ